MNLRPGSHSCRLHILPWITVLFVFSLLLEHATVEAKHQTATIDDEYGDSATGAKPTFLPDIGGFWQGSKCDSSCGYPECQGCGLSIDPKQAYKGTWHVATHRVGDPTDFVQIEFIGIEVSAFCIVPGPQDNITTQYELTFLLDGIPAGGIWTGPDGTAVTTIQYGVRCFHQSALDNKKHTLIVRAESMSFDTVFLFDYATYVYDDEQTNDITSVGLSSTVSPPESNTSQIPLVTSPSPSAMLPLSTSSSISPPVVRPSNVTSDSPQTIPSPNSLSSEVTSHSSSSSLSSLLPSPTSRQSSKAPSRQLVIILTVVVATVVCLSIAIFTTVFRLRRGRARARSGVEPRRSNIDPYMLRGTGTVWQEDNTLLEGATSQVASTRRTRRVKRKRRSAQATSTQSQSSIGRPHAEEALPPPYYQISLMM